MQPEKKLTAENEKSSAEQEALRKAEGVRVDFSYRDKMAMHEAQEEPSAQQYVDDLQGKLGNAHATLEKLRQAVMEGQHQTTDLDKKVAFQKLLNDAEYSAHHAFAKPEEPGRVRSQQQSLENAETNFQKRHVAPTERMLKVLTGELSGEALSPQKMYEAFRASNDEIGRLQRGAEARTDLPPDELTKLQSEVSVALERLQAMAPEINKMASEKAFSPGEKEEKLKQYAAMYTEYGKTRTELQELLQRLRGKT